tara:strand:- start:101 stop:220 length:120 start_codon:yes stop_codon:yes gene_type:complete
MNTNLKEIKTQNIYYAKGKEEDLGARSKANRSSDSLARM